MAALTRLAPYSHGNYTLKLHGGGRQTTKPGRLHVWSYDHGAASREFHLDVYEGERYIGHLTFVARGYGGDGK